MADSTPPTSEPDRSARPTGLVVMGWLAIAVVLLVGITAARDDEPSNAGEPVTTIEVADGATATRSDSTAAGGDTEGGNTEDGSTPVSSASTEAPSSTPTTQSDTTGSTNTSAPSVAATTTTIAAGASPSTTTVTAGTPPSTIVVNAPSTTIVVTAPSTTIVVNAPATTTAAPPSVPANDCAVLGADEFGDIQVELTAVSLSTALALLEIGFVVLDGGGAEIFPDFLVVEFVSPGEVMRLALETFEQVPPGNDVSSLSCVIDGLEVIELFPEQLPPGPEDTCSVLGVDDVGDLQLNVGVRNPTADTADLIFTFAVRDPLGTRVISDVGFADGLGAGQVTAQEVDTLNPPPAGVDIGSLTCDIVGLEVF